MMNREKLRSDKEFVLGKKISVTNMIWLLLLLGCALRIWYAVATPVTLRGHDIRELSADASGKAAYLLRLVQSGELPSSYERQNYQQPFYYLLSALVSKGLSALSGITTPEFLVNGGKVVSCTASCLSLFLAERLLRKFSSDRVRAFGVAVLSVTPAFILTGGRLGEDALTGLFMVAVLLGTLRWEEKPDWKNTILLSVLYGCGMMTKVSLAFPAFYTAYIFWKNRKTDRQFWFKMIVFGMISLPLGMWYSVRNFLLFGQPIGYVMAPDDFLYTGEKSYVARFFSFPIKNWLSSPYAEPLEDYNLPIYLLKSELFGEFQYDVPQWLSFLLLIVSTVFTFVIAAYGIYCVIKKISRKENKQGKLRPFSFGLLFGGYAAASYFSLPYGCSMDFRYYLMLTVCKALVLCSFLDEEPKGRFSQELLLLQRGMKVLCVLFVVLSVAFVADVLS